MRFTHVLDKPLEQGSSGPIEASIHSLVYAVSRDGRRITAPLVLIENTKSALQAEDRYS